MERYRSRQNRRRGRDGSVGETVQQWGSKEAADKERAGEDETWGVHCTSGSGRVELKRRHQCLHSPEASERRVHPAQPVLARAYSLLANSVKKSIRVDTLRTGPRP